MGSKMAGSTFMKIRAKKMVLIPGAVMVHIHMYCSTIMGHLEMYSPWHMKWDMPYIPGILTKTSPISTGITRYSLQKWLPLPTNPFFLAIFLKDQKAGKRNFFS